MSKIYATPMDREIAYWKRKTEKSRNMVIIGDQHQPNCKSRWRKYARSAQMLAWKLEAANNQKDG